MNFKKDFQLNQFLKKIKDQHLYLKFMTIIMMNKIANRLLNLKNN